jgi:ammonium transporter family
LLRAAFGFEQAAGSSGGLFSCLWRLGSCNGGGTRTSASRSRFRSASGQRFGDRPFGADFGIGHGHVDFAGSSVVHMQAGVIGLIFAWLIGPRYGKYDKDGKLRNQ